MFPIMKEHIVEWFKEMIGKKVDIRCLTAIFGGDRMMTRKIAARGLRELADKVENETDEVTDL